MHIFSLETPVPPFPQQPTSSLVASVMEGTCPFNICWAMTVLAMLLSEGDSRGYNRLYRGPTCLKDVAIGLAFLVVAKAKLKFLKVVFTN